MRAPSGRVRGCFHRRIGLAVAAGLCLAACTAAPPAATRIETSGATPAKGAAMTGVVEVELDIFSGRPNPSWTLAPAEAADFLGRLATLPAAALHEPEMPLGYRGFVVRVMRPGGADELRVRGGRVRLSRGDRVEWYGDPLQSLERLLLASGRAHLPDDLYRMAQEDAAR